MNSTVVKRLAEEILSSEDRYGYPPRVYEICSMLVAGEVPSETVNEMLDLIEATQAEWVYPTNEGETL